MLMEFVDGVTLKQKLQAGPMTVVEAVECVSRVLCALTHAHEKGVVHRDIKPSNVMVTPQGNIKLMDFGMAKAKTDSKLTLSSVQVGTPRYMSSEQIRGSDAALDSRSDLYSVGVFMYELLTKKFPFDVDCRQPLAILSAHLEKTPIPPRNFEPNVPSALNDIILKLLSKDPAARFATAGALHIELNRVREMLKASSPSLPPSAALHIPHVPFRPEARIPPSRRVPKWEKVSDQGGGWSTRFSALGLITILILGSAGGALYFWSQRSQEPVSANRQVQARVDRVGG